MIFHIFLLLFPLLNSALSNNFFNKITKNDSKITANLLSALHSYLYCFYGMYFLLTDNFNTIYILSNFSISYFIWDSYRILYSENENPIYIIHHIIAINTSDCILNKANNMNLLVFLFTVAELSNIVTYPLYHMIRSNKILNNLYFTEESINFLKEIQTLLSFIGRFLIYTYVFIFNDSLSNDIILYIELIIVYVLGNFWLFQQFRDIYTQNTIKNS